MGFDQKEADGEGYVPVGLTAGWQIAFDRLAEIVQKRIPWARSLKKHTFSIVLGIWVQSVGVLSLWLAPQTQGITHWLIFAILCIDSPFALWAMVANLGVFYEKQP